MADIESKVNIERVVHDAIANAIQNISDEFGLRVERIRIEWRDDSELSGYKYTVTGLTIRASSNHG